jgi:hypothetical protein
MPTSRIKKWLADRKHDPRYYKPLKVPARTAKTWINSVNGAWLLGDMFRDLSGGLVSFEKTSHSPMLTELVLKNSAKDLAEVAEVIKDVLPQPDIETSSIIQGAGESLR